jgi:hypothetical protein
MQSMLPGRGIGGRSFTELFDHRVDQQPRVALRGAAHDRCDVDDRIGALEDAELVIIETDELHGSFLPLVWIA